MNILNKLLGSRIFFIIAFIIAAMGWAHYFGLFEKRYEYDFRKAKWGMSVEEVKTSENRELLNEFPPNDHEKILYYGDNIEGLKTLITYEFVNNQLVEGEYDFSIDNINPSIGIDDFEKIKKYISKTYGNPKSESKYGNDVPHTKLLILAAIWKTHTTIINLNYIILTDTGNPRLSLVYESKRLKSLKDKMSESIENDNSEMTSK